MSGIVGVSDGRLLAGDELIEQNNELSDESEQDSLNDMCTPVVSLVESYGNSEHCKHVPAEEMSQKKNHTRRIGRICKQTDRRMSGSGAKRNVKGITPTCDPVPESRDEGMSMKSIFVQCLAAGREESQPGKRRRPKFNQQKVTIVTLSNPLLSIIIALYN